MYQYPKALIEFLTEQECEGNEIFTTQNEDSVIWIVVQRDLPDYYSILEWYEGDETYNHINLCGKAIKRFRNILKEQEK